MQRTRTVPPIAPAGLVALVVLAGACGSDEGVTWTRDVAPIVRDNCVRCHSQSGVAPFRLDDYDEASTGAESNEEVVLDSPTSTTWFLMVRSFRGDGPYRLTVTLRA